MQIAFHIGANCTDDDRLMKSILKNAATLAEHDIKAPGPGKYRRVIRETIQTLDGRAPAPDARQVLLETILDSDHPKRLIMSNPIFICVPNRIFENGVFYQQAAAKVRGLRDLFPNDDLSLYLALRDPATFLPATFAQSKAKNFGKFLQGIPLGDIRWSDVVKRIRAAAPDAELTVWCNEDTPFIWSELIRRISGLPASTRITGGFDLLTAIMSPEGMKRFLTYMRTHPPKTEAQKRRIIAAFLDKFALDDEVEEVVDLPGMDAQTLEALSAAYDADVDYIASMPDVTFIEA